MGLGDRLALMRAHAVERGPIEPIEREDDGEFAGLQKRVVIQLPPLTAADSVFPKTERERSLVASGNAGLDCETFLIQPGRNTPRLVVTGYQSADGRQGIVTGDANDPTVHARAFLAFTARIVGEDADEPSSCAMCDMHTVWRDGALCRVCDPEGKIGSIGNLLVNQNIAFDFCVIAEDAHQCDIQLGLVGHVDSLFDRVMRRIFRLLSLGLVEDVMLREQLVDLAAGSLGKDHESLTEQGNARRKSYSLKTLAKKYLDVDLDKFTYRMGYSRYHNKPLSDYDEGAVGYITDDVETALHVATRQQQRAQLHGLPVGARIPNSSEQSKAAFAFNLMSSWGIRTDLSKTQSLQADLDHWSRKLLYVLKDTGIVRATGCDAGTCDTKRTKELVAKCYENAGLTVPMTVPKNGKGGGNISLKGSVLEDISLIRLRGDSKDVYDENGEIDENELFQEPLYAFSQFKSFQKISNTYVPVLLSGTQRPINARYDIIKETGRVSCWGPNLTNLPRGGTKTVLQKLQSRVREAFVPREGFVFCSTDLDVAELCGLAQIAIWMVGYSKLADAINAGIDPHLLLAAEQLLHIPYVEAVARKKEKLIADTRQMAKSCSFGFPGGLGIHTFIEYAKASYNVYVTEDEARILKEKWFLQWPEMRVYFRMIASMMRGFDDKGQQVGDIEQFVSGRIRGKTRYTAACNTMFQGIVADAGKSALFEIQKACYLLGGEMYGARASVFVHDEVICELPEQHASEFAQAQTDILVRTVQAYCPDVKIRSTPALMRAWYKAAEAVYVNGRLVPWEPK